MSVSGSLRSATLQMIQHPRLSSLTHLNTQSSTTRSFQTSAGKKAESKEWGRLDVAVVTITSEDSSELFKDLPRIMQNCFSRQDELSLTFWNRPPTYSTENARMIDEVIGSTLGAYSAPREIDLPLPPNQRNPRYFHQVYAIVCPHALKKSWTHCAQFISASWIRAGHFTLITAPSEGEKRSRNDLSSLVMRAKTVDVWRDGRDFQHSDARENDKALVEEYVHRLMTSVYESF